MKKIIPLLPLALLSLLVPAPLFAQGVLLDAKVEFGHVSYDSAKVDAKENYNGDLLIYFFQEEGKNHQEVLSRALNNDTLARYMNENFARIAVDTAAPEGKEVLSLFRKDLPDWDFITVQRTGKSEPAGISMHGWGNIQDAEDVDRWLEKLRSVKHKEHLFDSEKKS